MVLEGGSVHVDGAGLVVTTEQCLLHPSRNPWMAQEQIEERVLEFLGADEMLWLGQGLIEDRDTDGHVDLIFAFTGPRAAVSRRCPRTNPNFANCVENVDARAGRRPGGHRVPAPGTTARSPASRRRCRT